MAIEAASIVMSAVGLATLFNTGVDYFDYIQLGANFERDFTTYQLRLEDTRMRLCRWGAAVGANDNIIVQRLLGPERVRQAGERLRQIEAYFKEAERLSQRYAGNGQHQRRTEPDPDRDLTPAARHVRSTARTLYRHQTDQVSWLQRARWTLYGEQTFRELINNANLIISGLEQLVPERRHRLQELAQIEVATIEDQQSLTALLNVTTRDDGTATTQDPVLATAINVHLSNHKYKGTRNWGEAQVQMGDNITADAIAVGARLLSGGSIYDDTVNSGNAKVLMGNFVGKSFWG